MSQGPCGLGAATLGLAPACAAIVRLALNRVIDSASSRAGLILVFVFIQFLSPSLLRHPEVLIVLQANRMRPITLLATPSPPQWRSPRGSTSSSDTALQIWPTPRSGSVRMRS